MVKGHWIKIISCFVLDNNSIFNSLEKYQKILTIYCVIMIQYYSSLKGMTWFWFSLPHFYCSCCFGLVGNLSAKKLKQTDYYSLFPFFLYILYMSVYIFLSFKNMSLYFIFNLGLSCKHRSRPDGDWQD